MYSLFCDTHTHTLYSRHAYSTIEENVNQASQMAVPLLGSTDHFSDMIYRPLSDPENLYDIRDFQYLMSTNIWPRSWKGVELLHGVEADIVDLEGNLFGHDIYLKNAFYGDTFETPKSLQDLVFDNCDYVIASVHKKDFAKGKTSVECTKAYLGALEQPKVLILGHIGRAGMPFDIDTVLLRAKELGKCIEVNEHTLRHYPEQSRLCRDILVRAAELGCYISTGSDAHISVEVGDFRETTKLLSEIDFPRGLIATSSAEQFKKVMKQAFNQ